jgi:hypothetical protein
MTTMSDGPEIELLHRAWEAMTGGDFAVLEESLAESAKWHGVEDGQLCSGRTEILEVMTRKTCPVVCGDVSRGRSRPALACSSRSAPSSHPTQGTGRWTTGSRTWS